MFTRPNRNRRVDFVLSSMPRTNKCRALKVSTAVLALAAAVCAAPASGEPVNFDRDVRPIFSENCFPCHGHDENKRKAGLRLDIEEGAFAKLKHGEFAVVPGDLTNSQLVYRIAPSDPDDVMPPASTGKKLSAEQIATLRQWVADGAHWAPHWAFIAPKRAALPAVKDKTWGRNGIDDFILARLEKEGLQPSRRAATPILLRRMSLDLTGLPPTPAQLARWEGQADPAGSAADELLRSPHFGERLASDWLDVARYADTHGFNNDAARTMWQWRDWVVHAFNANLPYDRFITDQLAGDLEPGHTMPQLIATGFNRNTGVNSEGGIVGEEYRVSYVADRVRTTSMAWMGLTMECSRCHDHKFDPVTQHDYFAFFNSVDEVGQDGRVANAAPLLSVPTEEQLHDVSRLRLRIETARENMTAMLAAQKWRDVAFDHLLDTVKDPAAAVGETLRLAGAPGPAISNAADGKLLSMEGSVGRAVGPLGERAYVFDGRGSLRSDGLERPSTNGWIFSAWVRRDAAQEGQLFSTARFTVPESSDDYGSGVDILLTADGALEARIASSWPEYSLDLVSRQSVPVGEWRQVAVSSDGSTKVGGLRLFIDGRECAREVVHNDLLDARSIEGKPFIGASGQSNAAPFAGAIAGLRVLRDASRIDSLADDWRQQSVRFAAATSPAERTSWQTDQIRRAWLEARDPSFARAAAEERAAASALVRLQGEEPDTMVMRDVSPPRPTHVLSRGQYDQPREAVQPDVPEFLLSFPTNAPRNRLGLAQWLTDPRNPLTARVVVNRFWASLFGHGIVKSVGNFGYQGDYPSHPQLLDWLALHFVDSGWNVKDLLRLMVTSATYAQSSDSNPDLNERDPENRLLARGPRQRLTAEMLRDQALFVSGLLYDKLGGPPVYPYQPTNLYKGIVVAADYPGTHYDVSHGHDLYRRALYTWWKRTVPYPALSIFDVPDREVCVVQRSETDTPLQALDLMNDPVQLEAARRLAERMLTEAGPSPAARLDFAFERATGRKPLPDESSLISALLQKRLDAYHADPQAAKDFLSVGESKPNSSLNPAELAAYANVASLILNLDQTITRD
jgi:hypothetical protein